MTEVEFVSERGDISFRRKLQDLYKKGYIVTQYCVTSATPGGNYYQDVQTTYSAILEKE